MEEKIEELIARMKAAGEDQDFIDATIAELRGQPAPASEPEETEPTAPAAEEAQGEGSVEGPVENNSLDYIAAALEKHRNYNATESQKAEAAARAAEKVRDLSNPANLRQSLVLDRLRQEEEGEGVSIGGLWESLTSGGGSSTAKNMARDAKAKEIVSNNLKESSDLQGKAIESLLAKHNKGLPSDQRIREAGEDGEYTSEYYDWLNGLSDEDITQGKVDELASRYEDEYFDSNVEEEMEDRAALGITRSDSQKAEEELAKNAVNQLEDEKGKLIKNQKSITNGLKGLKVKYDGLGSLGDKLTTLDNRAKKITSIEYKDQESFDKASKELEAIRTQFKKLNEEYVSAGGLSLDELNSEREAYLKAYGRAEDAMEGFSGREQDLGVYLDAMGRNYGFWANIGMGVASGFVKLGAAGAQVYKMTQDMPADLFSDVIPMLPDSLKPYASTVELGLGFMGRAMTNDVSGGVSHLRGEDHLGEVVERMWAWDESITNHMEKPGEFKDIEAWDLEGFGEWFGHLASTQAANTAVLFGTGGAALYVLGASAAGAKFHDIEKEMEGYANLHEDNPMHNFKYTKAQQYSAAILSGGFESASEKVSFGQAKWVKSMMKDSMLMKRGFNNFLQRNFATKTGLYRNFYDPVEEGFTETLAELGNNMTDWLVLGKDVSLLDGMHESFMSGLFMSGVVYKAPLVGKNMVKAFQSSDASAEIADISLKIQRKTEMLNTYELSDENIKALEGDINKLVTKHTILINETINGVQNMDSGTRTKLINIDVELARLRRSNKDLASDPSLTKEQVQELQNDNTRDMSDLKASKDHLIAEANKVDNTSQIERTTTRAQKDWEKITGKPVRFFRANKASAGIKGRAFKKADVDFIEGQLESKRKALEAAKGEDATALQEDISKLEKQLNQVRNYSLDEMGSAQGFESPVTGNIFINTEVSAETGGVNVVNHELMHSVLKKTLADNPRAALAMGNAVDDFLGKLDPDEVASSTMAARLRVYQDSPAATRSEEKVTLFMDALATGDIKITRSGNQKLGSVMRRAMQSAGLRDIKFETSEDVYNFITDFQASRKSIFFNKGIAKAARKGVKIGEGLLENVTQEQLDELAREEDSGDLKESRARIKKGTKVNTPYEVINKMAEGVETKAEWKESQGLRDAVKAVEPGGVISNMILSQKMSPAKTAETIKSVRDRLMNFDPASARKTGSLEPITLAEFMMSNIKFGKLDASKALFKEGERAKMEGQDIDAKTSDGMNIRQVAAETDSGVQAFEEQDMSMGGRAKRAKLVEEGKSESDQYSGLRTELGLEKLMMDQVRKAVMKTFGTKLPDINSKKFKAALQKAYRTELKKPIQDMIGKGETYNEFLSKNFPIVYKFLPKETLLQMERSVPAAQRIFTKSERIIKTTEVDRLVNEGLLPKETNRLSGPTLITKLPYPGSKKVMAYFRGKDMEGALGYKVGASTLGTRKDKLAMEMGVELGFDATMETIQTPEVSNRRSDILGLTGQVQAENEISVIGKQIDRDPGIKFSLTVRKLKPFERAVFYNNLPALSKALQRVNPNDEKAVLEAVREVYGKHYLAGKVTALGKDIAKLVSVYGSINKRHANLNTRPEQTLDKYLTDNIQAAELGLNLAEFLDLKDENGKALQWGDLFDDVHKINTGRAEIVTIGKKWVEIHGKAKAMMMLVHASGMYSTSSKIGRGHMFEVDSDGVVQEIDTLPDMSNKELLKLAASMKDPDVVRPVQTVATQMELAGVEYQDAWRNDLIKAIRKQRTKKYTRSLGTQRYQLFNGAKDFNKWVLKEVFGDEVSLTDIDNLRKFQTLDGVEVNTSLLAETSKAAMADRDYVGRKEQAAISELVVREIAQHYKDQIAAGVLDKEDFGMMMMSMASNMGSPLKRAANLGYIFKDKGGKKYKGKVRYEHMIPTNYMVMQLTNAYMNDGNVDLDALFKEYTVAVIPVTMDNILDEVKLTQVMPIGYLVGNSSTQRYYNMSTFGHPDLYALESLDPEESGKVYGEAAANANFNAGEVEARAKAAKTMDEALKASKSSAKPSKMFNGSSKSFDELGGRTGVIFLASDKREAEAYAESNRGTVRDIYVDQAKVGQEQQLLNKIEELGYSIEDALAYELMDTRFPNSLKQSEIDEVIAALKKDGVQGIEYTDGAQVVGGTTKSTMIFDKAIISETPIVTIKPKGITVLDFDDTLATTKSGVKARIPNPDGTPKPGRKVIFMAGGAGSGKGNVISKLGLKEAGYKLVNSDISLEWLKKNHGLPENQSDYTAEQRSQLSKLSAEARKIAKRKQGKFAGNGDGVVVDGTGGSIKMMGKLVEEFKAKGYDVSMVFVETSLEVAQQRNAARSERSLREGILNKNHEQVQGNKEAFKALFGKTFNEVSTDKIGLNDALPNSFKNKVDDFTNSYENRRLDAEEFAKEGGDIKANGGEFDFSEFNQVVEGETAPLFNKAMKLSGKFGTDNMFILTARSPDAAPAIKEFLDAQGLNIPLKNITGLAQSEASAKANWIAEKVGEGYNDFYFADDATQNVEAVQDMLDQFDVKGKVQQARLKFSKSGPKKMSEIIDEGTMDLNTILEQTKGVDRKKVFSAAKARKRGRNKGKFKFFVPPSAEDFAGLMYAFMGKGKQGEQHHQFFKENLFDPFSKGIRHLKQVQQAVANDLKELRKAMPDVRKKLDKTVPGTEYTHEDAIRVYNWVKAGFEVPGLSKTDKQALVDAVTNDASLSAFAQGINAIGSTPGGLVDPGKHWLGGNIALDLKEALDVARGTYLQQWKENVDIMFNEANLNKIEAIYGSNFREALEDSLWRMEHGGNRSRGSGRLLTNFTNWIHGSIGTTMFLNARSAMLQMISNVNFVNWSDNNMVAAAKAFGNQKQYWGDVSMIFNSDFLKQRRSGIQTDVNAAELLAQIKDSKNQVKAATAYLLQLGFTPTQIADSFAIATGGATFYRNRMKTYLKEGMTQAEAETKAFEDMMEIAEETQQSTREDKISQQQASPLGKFILAFQNTPMQYNRLIKKAALDLVNGRGDPKANISRIVYYGGIQNLIFYGLQTAVFAALFSDDEEDQLTDKKSERIMNGMVDTLLRGSGIGGAVVATVKNVIIKFMKEEEKEKDGNFMTRANHASTLIEALNISPPIGIKARKLYGATQTWDFNRDVIKHMSKTDIDNPAYDAISSATEAVTNIPLSRLYSKYQNISESLNADNEMWQRVAMFLGWNKWSFGIKNQDVVTAKGEVKEIKAVEAEERREMKKRAKDAERQAEEEIVIESNLLDQKEEREEGQEDIKCASVSKSGARCGIKVKGGGNFCTVHEKAPQQASGEKAQCSHVKPNGDRCKMQTASQSGKCYYHD